MKRLILAAFLFFNISCSHFKYISDSDIPFHISFVGGEGQKRQLKLIYTEQVYLWGQLDGGGVIDFGEYFSNYDIVDASSVKIRHYQSFKDQFFMYFSLGLYTPYTVEVSALTTKRDVF